VFTRELLPDFLKENKKLDFVENLHLRSAKKIFPVPVRSLRPIRLLKEKREFSEDSLCPKKLCIKTNSKQILKTLNVAKPGRPSKQALAMR
jgi:hypothetical protein